MKCTTFVAFVIFVILLCASLTLAAPINSTDTHGIVLYVDNGGTDGQYQLWNSTQQNFTTGELNVNDTGSLPHFTEAQANHQRDEVLVGTVSADDKIHLFVYDIPTDTFVHQTNVSNVDSQVSTLSRPFDIGIEDVSGEAMIIYANDSAVDNEFNYRIWDGIAISGETTVTLSSVAAEEEHNMLVPKRGTDQMMFIIQQANPQGRYAVLWNGTDFDEGTAANATTTALGNSGERSFNFAWESVSGNGIWLYVTTNRVRYRQFFANNNTWGDEQNPIGLGSGHNGKYLEVCPHPTTDHVGFTLQDSGADIVAYMWNGSGIMTGQPDDEEDSEQKGQGNPNYGCAWDKAGDYATFYYVDASDFQLSYFNYTKANESWSITDISDSVETVNLAVDDIQNLDISENPINNGTMLLLADLTEDIYMYIWNQSEFHNFTANPIEGNYRPTNGGGQFDFEWFRYDPEPTVVDLITNATIVAVNGTINFTVNVTDNIAVDIVAINITKPDNEVVEFNLTNNGIIYNLTSLAVNTNASGSYTILVIANDTSTHKNINTTETLTFDANATPTVDDPVFNITILTPNSGALSNTTYRDLEGDLGNLYFRWYRNNSEVFTENFTNIASGTPVNSTLSGVTLIDGDLLNVTVKADDSISNSTVHNTSTLTVIGNKAPTVDIPVYNGTPTKTLGLGANTTYKDEEGAAGLVNFEWFRNGSSIFTENLTSIANNTIVNTTLAVNLYNIGDEINITVIGNDNEDDSTVQESALTTVANIVPKVDTIVLNVSNITKTSGVGANTTYYDDDEGIATVYFEWFLNGSSVFTQNISSIVPNVTVNSTLTADLYNVGDEINVTVYANDTRNETTLSNTSVLVVQNIAPSVDVPVFNVTNITTESGVAINTTYYDDDEGIATVHFEWFTNGTSAFTENITSIAPNVTVNSTLATNLYEEGDLVNVTVFANDTRNISTTQNSATVTVNNLTRQAATNIDVANISGLDYSPVSITKKDTVLFNATFNATSDNATNMNVTLTVDNAYVNGTEVDITAGSSLIVNLSWASATNGTHTIRMNADANNTFSETNETNNNVTITISVANPVSGGGEEAGAAAPPPASTSPESSEGLSNAKKYSYLETGQAANAKAFGKTYKITVSSIYPNSVRLDIGGVYNTILLKGISKSFDMNGDGVGDITIYVDDVISYSKATISIREEEPDGTGTESTSFVDFGAIWESIVKRQTEEGEETEEAEENEESWKDEEIKALKEEIKNLKNELAEKEARISSLETDLVNLFQESLQETDTGTRAVLEARMEELRKELEVMREEYTLLEEGVLAHAEALVSEENEEANEETTKETAKTDGVTAVKQTNSLLAVTGNAFRTVQLFTYGFFKKGSTTGAAVVQETNNFVEEEVVTSSKYKAMTLILLLLFIIAPVGIATYIVRRKRITTQRMIKETFKAEINPRGVGSDWKQHTIQEHLRNLEGYITNALEKKQSLPKIQEHLAVAGWTGDTIQQIMKKTTVKKLLTKATREKSKQKKYTKAIRLMKKVSEEREEHEKKVHVQNIRKHKKKVREELKNVEEFVRKALKKNHSLEYIKAHLIEQGWLHEVVEHATKKHKEQHEKRKQKEKVKITKKLEQHRKKQHKKEITREESHHIIRSLATIEQFIVEHRKNGYSKRKIRNALDKAGWPEALIDKAMKNVKN
jgi:peroxiredoxin